MAGQPYKGVNMQFHRVPLVLAASFLAWQGCLLEDDKSVDVTDPLDSTVAEVEDPGTWNFHGPEGLVANGGFVFVANTAFDGTDNSFGSGFVTVVRQTDFAVVNKIVTSHRNPQTLTVHDGKVYVLCSGTSVYDGEKKLVTPTSDGSLEVIDVATAATAFAPQTVIPIPRSTDHPLVGYPSSLAITADGKLAYAGSGTTAALFKMDLEDSKVLRGSDDPIVLGDIESTDSMAVAAGPDGVIFAGSFNRDQVFAVDTATDLKATDPFGVVDAGTTANMDGVLHMVYRDSGIPDLFVLLGLASTAMAVTTAQGQAGVETLLTPTGLYPNRLAVHGDTLYVVNSGDNNVTAVTISSGVDLGKVAIFALDTNPFDLTIADNDGSTVLYVTGFSSNALYEVDPVSGSILRVAQ